MSKSKSIITLRLIEVRRGKVWHSYLTSVLEPEVLPPYVFIDLYQKRWRIEDAFNTVKRLLGLSLWTGLRNILNQDNSDLVLDYIKPLTSWTISNH